MIIKFKLLPVNEIILNTYYNEIYNNIFSNLSNELNKTKDLLNEIPLEDFYMLSKMHNPYYKLSIQLKNNFNIQFVTNAVLKMYELISQFNLIKQFKNKNINVFCNAELPGGFIIAINHYIKTYYPDKKLNWAASSFIGSETALDDKYNIYKCNKNNWLMDDNMNGDITKIENINIIIEKIYNRFPNGVNLYTSDIGIDVSSDFNNQEIQTLELNYYQILCGLLTLNKNGSMVIKQFTFFTPFNISILNLLTALFKKVYITKPETSKKINSEIYIVCKEYHEKINERLKEYLINIKPKPNIPIILIDKEIETDLFDIANQIYTFQIENLLNLYNSYNQFKNKLYLLKKILIKNNEKIMDNWVNKNPIKKINPIDHILQICDE